MRAVHVDKVEVPALHCSTAWLLVRFNGWYCEVDISGSCGQAGMPMNGK